MAPAPASREITNLSLSYGVDNTLALADISERIREYNVALTGASTSIYANRMGQFGNAVKEYQDALMAYRKVMKSRSGIRHIAKQKVERAFQDLQIKFRHELSAVTAQNRSRKGTPLTSSTRATNIARSSRTAVKLDVTSQVQANNLVKFSKHAKFLGNGLAVIDFSSRVGSIHNSYKSGGEWERELFVESASFATSALAATAVVNAGSALLGIIMVATPAGWVGLVIGGIVVAGIAGSAAAASIWTNNQIKENSSGWYDEIMNWIDIK